MGPSFTYAGNSRLIYAVVRNADVFSKLANLSFKDYQEYASKKSQEDAKRRQDSASQEVKEGSSDEQVQPDFIPTEEWVRFPSLFSSLLS